MRRLSLFLIVLGVFILGVECTSHAQEVDTDCIAQLKSINEKAFSIGLDYPDSCIWYTNQALKLSKTCFDSTEVAFAYSSAGEAYYLMGELEKGIQYLDSGLLFAKKKDTNQVSDIHVSKANCYSDLGFYNSAIGELYQSLKYYYLVGDTEMIATSEYNFGLIFYNQNSFFQAKEHFNNSIEFYSYLNKDSENQQSYFLLSMIYSKLHQFDSASYYIEKAKDLKAYQTKFDSGFLLNTISLFHEEQNDYNYALNLLKESNLVFKSIPDYWSLCDNYIGQAALYNKLKQPQEALLMLDSAQELNNDIHSILYNQYIHKTKAKSLELSGNHKEASREALIAISLDDSIQLQDYQTMLHNDQGSYFEIVSSNLKTQNASLINISKEQSEQLEITRLISVVSLIMGVLAIVALLIFIRNNRKEKNENKLKNRVLSVIGHDIRTPLGQLQTIVEMIDSKEVDRDSLEIIIPELKKSLSKARSSVENILEWARSELVGIEANKTVVDVKTVIDQAVQYNFDLINEKKIQIKLSGDQSCKVRADQNHVLIAVRNIINNALKFSNEGGSVQINFKPTTDNKIVIQIKDFGIGMSEEIKSKLFHKAIDNRASGTGIGLMLSKEYIEVNGGCIELDSQVGNGTTFTISLPKA